MTDGYGDLSSEQTALLAYLAIHGEQGLLKSLSRFKVSEKVQSAMWLFFNELVQRYGLANHAHDYRNGLEIDYGNINKAITSLLGENK